MAKYELEVEIQGFKLRVKGERNEDISRITGEIGQHLAGILQPPANLLDAPVRRQVDATVQPSQDGQDGDLAARGKGTRRRKGSANSNSAAPVAPISWQHDPAKWGTPKQTWTGGNKILWLLYVIKNEASQTAVSASGIVGAFNAKFREFGPLVKSSMPRTLGNLKTNQPALVMSDNTKPPITWYLTDEGGKAAERLVTEARSATGAQQANP